LGLIRLKAAINCDDLLELWKSVNENFAEYAYLFSYHMDNTAFGVQK
jgi:hypothetical protein